MTGELVAAGGDGRGVRDRIQAFRRQYTLARVDSMRDAPGLYLPDNLVDEVIETWTAFFAEHGYPDDALLEFCIRDAHELAAANRPWRPDGSPA